MEAVDEALTARGIPPGSVPADHTTCDEGLAPSSPWAAIRLVHMHWYLPAGLDGAPTFGAQAM